MNKQSKFQDDIIYKSIVHELIRDRDDKKENEFVAKHVIADIINWYMLQRPSYNWLV